MNNADVLIKNAYIITLNSEREVIPNGCIAVKRDRIADVGGSELLSQYEAARVVDANGEVVLPGFISTHSHLFQNMLKGLGRDNHLQEWLNSSIRRALHNFDGETVYYAAMCGCIEAIRSGTTTILDYMYCHAQPGLDEQVTAAFEDIGIRGILGRSFSQVKKYPKENAFEYIESEQDFLDDIRRLEGLYRNHSRISVAIAPGIIWDHTDDGFREMRHIADELKLPITIHIVETPDDNKFSIENYGEKAITHLDRLGVLGPDFIGVHCVNMEEDDFEIFKARDVKISYNPISNMILASGVAPVIRFLKDGLTVSLACDGSASSDTQNYLEVLKNASLLQKVYSRDPKSVPAVTALEMATLGGAKAVGKESDIGSLESGKKADMIFFDPNTVFSCPAYDPITALVYSSTPASIKSVMVDGNMVMEKGSIVNADEERILYEARRCGIRLVEKTGLGNIQWNQKIKIPEWHL